MGVNFDRLLECIWGVGWWWAPWTLSLYLWLPLWLGLGSTSHSLAIPGQRPAVCPSSISLASCS